MAVDPAFSAAVAARTGQTMDDALLEQLLMETMAYVRLLAPCKRSVWLTWADLPEDIQAIVVASASRTVENPNNIRQQTIGEYSVTYSGAGEFNNGPFSNSETRIITALAGCGGGLKTVTMLTPDPVDIGPLDDYYGLLDPKE